MSHPCVVMEFSNEALRVYIDEMLQTEYKEYGIKLEPLDKTHFFLLCSSTAAAEQMRLKIAEYTRKYFDSVVYDTSKDKSVDSSLDYDAYGD